MLPTGCSRVATSPLERCSELGGHRLYWGAGGELLPLSLHKDQEEVPGEEDTSLSLLKLEQLP